MVLILVDKKLGKEHVARIQTLERMNMHVTDALGTQAIIKYIKVWPEQKTQYKGANVKTSDF